MRVSILQSSNQSRKAQVHYYTMYKRNLMEKTIKDKLFIIKSDNISEP